jgi:acyl dehydratase
MAYQLKGKTFDEFSIGDVFQTANRTITETDVVNFAGLSGDFNPLHTDQTFAENTPYKERVVHGLLGVAVGSGLANQLGILEGTTIALLAMEVQYQGAILLGDTIHLEIKVIEKKESSKPDRGTVTFSTDLINQRGEVVTTGKWMVLMSRTKG